MQKQKVVELFSCIKERRTRTSLEGYIPVLSCIFRSLCQFYTNLKKSLLKRFFEIQILYLKGFSRC